VSRLLLPRFARGRSRATGSRESPWTLAEYMTLSTIRTSFQVVCLLFAFASALLAMLAFTGLVPYGIALSMEWFLYLLILDFIFFDLFAWIAQKHLLIGIYLSGFYTAIRIAVDATTGRFFHAQILSGLLILIVILLGMCRLSRLWQRNSR
jgi:hypothetical protein